MIGLAALNALPDAEARAALERCCGSRAWVERMAARRPFASVEQLLDLAAEIWQALTPDDWREAFGHHPRIGDLDSLRSRFAASTDLAAREQGSVAAAGEETLAVLAEGNRAYERKFGYIFIVRASGRSAGEMLAALRARLPNRPDAEIRIAAAQQLEITRLRLERLAGTDA